MTVSDPLRATSSIAITFSDGEHDEITRTRLNDACDHGICTFDVHRTPAKSDTSVRITIHSYWLLTTKSLDGPTIRVTGLPVALTVPEGLFLDTSLLQGTGTVQVTNVNGNAGGGVIPEGTMEIDAQKLAEGEDSMNWLLSRERLGAGANVVELNVGPFRGKKVTYQVTTGRTETAEKTEVYFCSGESIVRVLMLYNTGDPHEQGFKIKFDEFLGSFQNGPPCKR